MLFGSVVNAAQKGHPITEVDLQMRRVGKADPWSENLSQTNTECTTLLPRQTFRISLR